MLKEGLQTRNHWNVRAQEIIEQQNRLINKEEQFLVFTVLYNDSSPIYFPEMFMNVCQNFLYADELLSNDFKELLDITKRMSSNLKEVDIPRKKKQIEPSLPKRFSLVSLKE